MSKLEESGMNIGDFAMSLIESGNISKKVQTSEVARPAALPVSEVDISDVKVPSSMMNKVLQESFGVDNEVPEKVQEPQLSEQEVIEERIVTLKSELVETINKLTGLVSEAASMVEGFTGVMSFGPGAPTGKYRGRNKPTRKIRRRKK
jgi:hypothetical protein